MVNKMVSYPLEKLNLIAHVIVAKRVLPSAASLRNKNDADKAHLLRLQYQFFDTPGEGFEVALF